MSKFTSMNFNIDGHDIEFVAHAKKYSKAEAIQECVAENDWKFYVPEGSNDDGWRLPTEEDIALRYVKYYPTLPDYCGSDQESGYTYCNKDARGCFPVWVISFEDLKS